MRLRAHHWILAFALALLAHLLLFLSQQEALLQPPQLQFRGGGLLDEGGDRPESGGVLVTLGRVGDTPGDAPEEIPTNPQPLEEVPTPPEVSRPETVALPEPEPEPEEPEPEPEIEVLEDTPVEPEPEPEPEAPAEIATAAPPEPTVETPPPPVPLRKPEPPRPAPQLEVVERRLPVQAPAETPPEPPAQTEAQPEAASESAQAPSETVVAGVLPISPGRIGDASGNETGLVPRLNYEQRVLLWLKRHGNYPRDSYRYNQEGIVLLEFTINRNGRILSYDILESSGYHLLDRAVREMMARASPVPPMPATIPEAQMRFTVPVRFERG